MSAAASARPEAAPGTRCLVLQLEPTPYILPRALYLYRDASLHTDLYFTYLNASQPWGDDVEIGKIPVLLDPSISRIRQIGRVARLMLRILRREYTVAHLAGWGHWVVRLAFLCCKLRRVPFSVESDTLLEIRRFDWKQRLKKWIYPILMRWPAMTIPGGSRQAAYFRYYGVPEERISISHMTVDTAAIRKLQTPARDEFRAMHGVPKDGVLLLFVGRLLELKGLDTLFSAFETAMRRVDSLALIIVGDGPERGKVEEFKNQNPGRVWTVGRQSSSGVVAWMRACDILVLPSRNEQWGLVVNEAMTCGLPVIVSDACGCVEDLVHLGKTGFIFPVDDVEKLTAAILRLAKEPELRAALGAESSRVIDPWVIERQAETIRTALVQMSYSR